MLPGNLVILVGFDPDAKSGPSPVELVETTVR
jgi:hypothetical protein